MLENLSDMALHGFNLIADKDGFTVALHATYIDRVWAVRDMYQDRQESVIRQSRVVASG